MIDDVTERVQTTGMDYSDTSFDVTLSLIVMIRHS